MSLSPDGGIPHEIISDLALEAFPTESGDAPAAYQASSAVFGFQASTRGLGKLPRSILSGTAVAFACTPGVAVAARLAPFWARLDAADTFSAFARGIATMM